MPKSFNINRYISTISIIGVGAIGYYLLRRRPSGLLVSDDVGSSGGLESINNAIDSAINFVSGNFHHDELGEEFQAEMSQIGDVITDYPHLTTRKGFRDNEYQVSSLEKRSDIEDYSSRRELGFIRLYGSRPLNRRAVWIPEGVLKGSTQVNGNPACVSAILWATYKLYDKGKIGSNWYNYGCYANGKKWHGYGCAVDLPQFLSEQYIYTLRTVKDCHIQWCDINNNYWMSTADVSPGAKKLAKCSGSHKDHIHLEVAPNKETWSILLNVPYILN